MATLIPSEYHPKNAERKEEVGAFDLYHFKDGAQLLLSRNMRKKVFVPFLKFPKWKLKRELVGTTTSKEYRKGKQGAVVRNKKPFTRWPYTTPERFLYNYRKMLAARVRFETPFAWLQTPRQPPIIVTKLNDRKSLYEVEKTAEPELMNRALQNAARELGKMHGAGVRHGHPHSDNILVDEKGNITLVDPKFIEEINSVIPEPGLEPGVLFDASTYNRLVKAKFPSAANTNDLGRLIESWVNNRSMDWDKIRLAYEKGYTEGKRRVEAAKL